MSECSHELSLGHAELLLFSCLMVIAIRQSVEGGYDQSKNWKVGRSDLSKNERSDAPTSQKLEGRSAPTSQFLKGRSIRPSSFCSDHSHRPLTEETKAPKMQNCSSTQLRSNVNMALAVCCCRLCTIARPGNNVNVIFINNGGGGDELAPQHHNTMALR